MTLETIQETKHGGPYTKPEQEERRSKVYELYFEKGYSARKIAKELDVNRNTIDSDIRVLLSQTSSHLGKDKIAGMILNEIERFKVQRKRVLDLLDTTDFKKSITAEKLLLAIGDKLSSLVSKLAKAPALDYNFSGEEISEEEIVDTVREIVFSQEYPSKDSEKTIIADIMTIQKCNTEHAENVYEKMQSLGLWFCVTGNLNTYDLVEYALMRDYISEEEYAKIKQPYEERIRKEKEEKQRKQEEEKRKSEERFRREEEIKKKYQDRYGADMFQWSDAAYNKYHHEVYG